MLFLLHDKHIAQHHAGFVGIGMTALLLE